MSVKLQNVWVTHNHSPNTGFFTWIVWEYTGIPSEREKINLTETRDGGYVVIECLHFWKEEEAKDWETPGFWQTVTVI